MKKMQEDKSISETIKPVESVLKTLENMFFTMPIPEEIAEKYNYLKESKYKVAGLTFTPVTKTQYPTIGSIDKPLHASELTNTIDLKGIEDSYASLNENCLALFEALFNQITDRILHLTDVAKDPFKSPYCT